MLKYLISRSYRSVSAKNLIKALAAEKRNISKEYKLKDELLSFIRENQIRVIEKPFRKEMVIKLEKERLEFEISFESGLYPYTNAENPKDILLYFPFEISFNKERKAILLECLGLDYTYYITRALLTSYPIKINRKTRYINEIEYRGRLSMKVSENTLKELHATLEEFAITEELIRYCILLARDKHERLYSAWIDKVHNYLITD